MNTVNKMPPHVGSKKINQRQNVWNMSKIKYKAGKLHHIIIISGFTSVNPPSSGYDVAWQQCLSRLPSISIYLGLLLGRGWTPGGCCGWLPPRSFLVDLLEFGLWWRLGLTPWQSMRFNALCDQTISGVCRCSAKAMSALEIRVGSRSAIDACALLVNFFYYSEILNGDSNMLRGSEKKRTINKHPHPFIRHLRVKYV